MFSLRNKKNYLFQLSSVLPLSRTLYTHPKTGYTLYLRYTVLMVSLKITLKGKTHLTEFDLYE